MLGTSKLITHPPWDTTFASHPETQPHSEGSGRGMTGKTVIFRKQFIDSELSYNKVFDSNKRKGSLMSDTFVKLKHAKFHHPASYQRKVSLPDICILAN